MPAKQTAKQYVEQVIADRLNDPDKLWPTKLSALVQLAADVTDHHEPTEDPPVADIIAYVKAAYPHEYSQIAAGLEGRWTNGVPEEWK